jgi:hypothetical protein
MITENDEGEAAEETNSQVSRRNPRASVGNGKGMVW